MTLSTPFTQQLGIELPIICGAMYPCSNPELVAAASEAGGLGIVQPISMSYVHGYELREGLRFIRQLTSRPIGMNALIEGSNRAYRRRMQQWVGTALEEGVKFFVTSLGKPRWVVDMVHASGGLVYHDVTERRWALKALESGVDGLIAVNERAGGHPGPLAAEALLEQVGDLGVPVICAGGIGGPQEFVQALGMGYAGVQMGTAFIATHECRASEQYKAAIVASDESDIVLSERITGVPVAVIRTASIERMGLKAGWLARRLLRGQRTKHMMRALYSLRSLWQLKRALLRRGAGQEYWQAGKSVAGVHQVQHVAELVQQFVAAASTEPD